MKYISKKLENNDIQLEEYLGYVFWIRKNFNLWYQLYSKTLSERYTLKYLQMKVWCLGFASNYEIGKRLGYGRKRLVMVKDAW